MGEFYSDENVTFHCKYERNDTGYVHIGNRTSLIYLSCEIHDINPHNGEEKATNISRYLAHDAGLKLQLVGRF